MGRISSRFSLGCVQRHPTIGKMKTVYLVCLVVAGAALAKATCNLKDRAYCAPILTEDDNPVTPDPPECHICQARAIAEKCTNPKKFVPACDGNKFARYQYDPEIDEHWCVYIDGQEITDPTTRGTGDVDPAKCAAFPERPEKSEEKETPCTDKKAAAGEDGAFIVCETDGTFAPEQVKGVYRWCTHPNGQPIPATFTEGAVVEPKNCQFYREFRYTCAEDGNFEVDWDCTRYITCSSGFAHLCKCPAKQAWDTTLGICNWIAQVPRCGKA